MVTRLKITLEQNEYSALLRIARLELRNPSDQARHIIRLDLDSRGLLGTEDSNQDHSSITNNGRSTVNVQ